MRAADECSRIVTIWRDECNGMMTIWRDECNGKLTRVLQASVGMQPGQVRVLICRQWASEGGTSEGWKEGGRSTHAC